MDEIGARAAECEQTIKSLGKPLPKDGKEKIHIIWKLLSEFSERYRAAIKGKSVDYLAQEEDRLSTGSMIKFDFENLYE